MWIYVWLFPFVVINTLLPCAFASPSRICIFLCAFASSLGHLHLLLHTCIYPPTYLSWANIIAELCLQSTLRQTWSQDFARDPPLGKHYCRTLLVIHLWANLIAGLCLQSTLGQTSSRDFARDPSLGKPHYRTPPTGHFWSTWSVPDQSAICPSTLYSKLLPFTLSIPPPSQPSSCYYVESIPILKPLNPTGQPARLEEKVLTFWLSYGRSSHLP